MKIDEITNRLKDLGYRSTTPRTEILKALSSTNLLSAHEVFDLLRRTRSNVDLVTTYRTLELFEKLGFIRKIYLDDKTARYELVNDKHHHHLVCVNCKDVEDVKIKEELLINQIKKQSQFKVEKHALEFFGFCINCQNQDQVFSGT